MNYAIIYAYTSCTLVDFVLMEIIKSRKDGENMATALLGKQLPLSIAYPELFILLKISPRMGYDSNGNPTDKQCGYTLICVETEQFNKVKIKIPMIKSALTQDDLESLKAQSKRVFVTITNGKLKPYYSSVTKTIEDSIEADGFEIVESKL